MGRASLMNRIFNMTNSYSPCEPAVYTRGKFTVHENQVKPALPLKSVTALGAEDKTEQFLGVQSSELGGKGL